MSYKLYVIIVTYNGTKWIENCLNSIPEYHKIIVVDNNSTDNTVSFIGENFPHITVLPQKSNLGFGGGNNLGISYAIAQGADYIFLLNQDAYLNSDTIDTLVKMHQLNTKYGVLSPIHLNGGGNELDWNFSTYLQRDTLKTVRSDLGNRRIKEIKICDTPFVNAAAWLLPVTTINTVGGFDPIFFHYGEDNNYCQRVLFHKLKIGIVTNTYVIHDRVNKPLNPKISLKETLKKREKQLKVNWADINKDNLSEASERKKNLFRKLLVSLFKLSFSDTRSRWAEINLINNIIPEIRKSKKRNKVKGRHYINE